MRKRTNGPLEEGELDSSPSLCMIENAIRRNPLLKPAEEIMLAEKYQQTGDPDAKRRLIESNYKLVINIARKFLKHYPGFTLQDVFCAGVIGLQHAAERFNPKLGFRFSTYATHWIRQAIGRAFDETYNTIRRPSYVTDQLRKFWRVHSHLEQELCGPPTITQLAQRLGWPTDRVQAFLCMDFLNPVSLDIKVGEKNTTLSEFIPDESSENGDYDGVSEKIETMLAELPERERLVILWRYGFYGDVTNLNYVAHQLGVSRERVRQLERTALQRLRKIPGAAQLFPIR